MSMRIRCTCNNCSEQLEFEKEQVGSFTTCPKCGMDTVLFIPNVPIPGPELIPMPSTGSTVKKLAFPLPFIVFVISLYGLNSWHELVDLSSSPSPVWLWVWWSLLILSGTILGIKLFRFLLRIS